MSAVDFQTSGLLDQENGMLWNSPFSLNCERETREGDPTPSQSIGSPRSELQAAQIFDVIVLPGVCLNGQSIFTPLIGVVCKIKSDSYNSIITYHQVDDNLTVTNDSAGLKIGNTRRDQNTPESETSRHQQHHCEAVIWKAGTKSKVANILRKSYSWNSCVDSKNDQVKKAARKTLKASKKPKISLTRSTSANSYRIFNQITEVTDYPNCQHQGGEEDLQADQEFFINPLVCSRTESTKDILEVCTHINSNPHGETLTFQNTCPDDLDLPFVSYSMDDPAELDERFKKSVIVSEETELEYDPLYKCAFDFAKSHGYGFVEFVEDRSDSRQAMKHPRRKKALLSASNRDDRVNPVTAFISSSNKYRSRRDKCMARPRRGRFGLSEQNMPDCDKTKCKHTDSDIEKVKAQSPTFKTSCPDLMKEPSPQRNRHRIYSKTKLSNATSGTLKMGLESPEDSHERRDDVMQSVSLHDFKESLTARGQKGRRKNYNTYEDISTRSRSIGVGDALNISKIKCEKMIKSSIYRNKLHTCKLGRNISEEVKESEFGVNYSKHKMFNSESIIQALDTNASKKYASDSDEKLWSLVSDKHGKDASSGSGQKTVLPHLKEVTSLQYKLCNSLSATIFRETQLTQKSFGTEHSNNLSKENVDVIQFTHNHTQSEDRAYAHSTQSTFKTPSTTHNRMNSSKGKTNPNFTLTRRCLRRHQIPDTTRGCFKWGNDKPEILPSFVVHRSGGLFQSTKSKIQNLQSLSIDTDSTKVGDSSIKLENTCHRSAEILPNHASDVMGVGNHASDGMGVEINESGMGIKLPEKSPEWIFSRLPPPNEQYQLLDCCRAQGCKDCEVTDIGSSISAEGASTTLGREVNNNKDDCDSNDANIDLVECSYFKSESVQSENPCYHDATSKRLNDRLCSELESADYETQRFQDAGKDIGECSCSQFAPNHNDLSHCRDANNNALPIFHDVPGRNELDRFSCSELGHSLTNIYGPTIPNVDTFPQKKYSQMLPGASYKVFKHNCSGNHGIHERSDISLKRTNLTHNIYNRKNHNLFITISRTQNKCNNTESISVFPEHFLNCGQTFHRRGIIKKKTKMQQQDLLSLASKTLQSDITDSSFDKHAEDLSKAAEKSVGSDSIVLNRSYAIADISCSLNSNGVTDSESSKSASPSSSFMKQNNARRQMKRPNCEDQPSSADTNNIKANNHSFNKVPDSLCFTVIQDHFLRDSHTFLGHTASRKQSVCDSTCCYEDLPLQETGSPSSDCTSRSQKLKEKRKIIGVKSWFVLSVGSNHTFWERGQPAENGNTNNNAGGNSNEREITPTRESRNKEKSSQTGTSMDIFLPCSQDKEMINEFCGDPEHLAHQFVLLKADRCNTCFQEKNQSRGCSWDYSKHHEGQDSDLIPSGDTPGVGEVLKEDIVPLVPAKTSLNSSKLPRFQEANKFKKRDSVVAANKRCNKFKRSIINNQLQLNQEKNESTAKENLQNQQIVSNMRFFPWSHPRISKRTHSELTERPHKLTEAIHPSQELTKPESSAVENVDEKLNFTKHHVLQAGSRVSLEPSPRPNKTKQQQRQSVANRPGLNSKHARKIKNFLFCPKTEKYSLVSSHPAVPTSWRSTEDEISSPVSDEWVTNSSCHKGQRGKFPGSDCDRKITADLKDKIKVDPITDNYLTCLTHEFSGTVLNNSIKTTPPPGEGHAIKEIQSQSCLININLNSFPSLVEERLYPKSLESENIKSQPRSNIKKKNSSENLMEAKTCVKTSSHPHQATSREASISLDAHHLKPKSKTSTLQATQKEYNLSEANNDSQSITNMSPSIQFNEITLQHLGHQNYSPSQQETGSTIRTKCKIRNFDTFILKLKQITSRKQRSQHARFINTASGTKNVPSEYVRTNIYTNKNNSHKYSRKTKQRCKIRTIQSRKQQKSSIKIPRPKCKNIRYFITQKGHNFILGKELKVAKYALTSEGHKRLYDIFRKRCDALHNKVSNLKNNNSRGVVMCTSCNLLNDIIDKFKSMITRFPESRLKNLQKILGLNANSQSSDRRISDRTRKCFHLNQKNTVNNNKSILKGCVRKKIPHQVCQFLNTSPMNSLRSCSSCTVCRHRQIKAVDSLLTNRERLERKRAERNRIPKTENVSRNACQMTTFNLKNGMGSYHLINDINLPSVCKSCPGDSGQANPETKVIQAYRNVCSRNWTRGYENDTEKNPWSYKLISETCSTNARNGSNMKNVRSKYCYRDGGLNINNKPEKQSCASPNNSQGAPHLGYDFSWLLTNQSDHQEKTSNGRDVSVIDGPMLNTWNQESIVNSVNRQNVPEQHGQIRKPYGFSKTIAKANLYGSFKPSRNICSKLYKSFLQQSSLKRGQSIADYKYKLSNTEKIKFIKYLVSTFFNNMTPIDGGGANMAKEGNAEAVRSDNPWGDDICNNTMLGGIHMQHSDSFKPELLTRQNLDIFERESLAKSNLEAQSCDSASFLWPQIVSTESYPKKEPKCVTNSGPDFPTSLADVWQNKNVNTTTSSSSVKPAEGDPGEMTRNEQRCDNQRLESNMPYLRVNCSNIQTKWKSCASKSCVPKIQHILCSREFGNKQKMDEECNSLNNCSTTINKASNSHTNLGSVVFTGGDKKEKGTNNDDGNVKDDSCADFETWICEVTEADNETGNVKDNSGTDSEPCMCEVTGDDYETGNFEINSCRSSESWMVDVRREIDLAKELKYNNTTPSNPPGQESDLNVSPSTSSSEGCINNNNNINKKLITQKLSTETNMKLSCVKVQLQKTWGDCRNGNPTANGCGNHRSLSIPSRVRKRRNDGSLEDMSPASKIRKLSSSSSVSQTSIAPGSNGNASNRGRDHRKKNA